MPCLSSGIRTHDLLIASREHEPLHHSGCSPKDLQEWRYKLDERNYRPIAVMSHLMKILERAVCNQFRAFLDENKILSTRQSGFRPRRSTNAVLLDVNEYLLRNIDNVF